MLNCAACMCLMYECALLQSAVHVSKRNKLAKLLDEDDDLVGMKSVLGKHTALQRPMTFTSHSGLWCDSVFVAMPVRSQLQ